MPKVDRHKDRWVVRASLAGLLVVLCFLAGFSVVTERGVAARSARADRAIRLAATYQDARHWVSEQKSVERQYRIEASSVVRAAHGQAERRLKADLNRILVLDDSPATRDTVTRLLRLQADYHSGSQALFDAVDAQNTDLETYFDHTVIDPVFGVLADEVYRGAAAASAAALRQSAGLRADEARANRAVSIAVALGLVLLAAFAVVLVRNGRRLAAARAAEVERLAEMAITEASQPPRLPRGHRTRAAARVAHRRPRRAGDHRRR
jgi:hypothetical protein